MTITIHFLPQRIFILQFLYLFSCCFNHYRLDNVILQPQPHKLAVAENTNINKNETKHTLLLASTLVPVRSPLH